MTTLKIPGHSDKRLRSLEPGVGTTRDIAVTHAVRLEAKRSATSEDYVIEGLKDDDVLELTFEDDIRRWVSVAEFKREFGDSAARGARADELVVPLRLPAGGRTRGLGTWALKVLRVFDFDPAAKTAGGLAKFYDAKLTPTPGLFRLASPSRLGGKVRAGSLPVDKPILVFIHGTASRTASSFGGVPADIWSDLRATYGENILGLEHHTLAVSPVHNALELAKQIPPDARLHLVSHSRGGLVGELLCRGALEKADMPFDEFDRDLFKGQPKAIRDALSELGETLSEKRLRIERFVRVACPAGGTTLASGRLDRWLEVIVNVLGKLSGLSANPVYGIVTEFLLDVKKQSANAEQMPGLAAMVPSSPLVRLLNRADIEVDADLSVIAGDIEGSGILGRLGVFFTDLFYLEDHDLVVHTRAMYGGARRTKEARFFFDKGAGVSHFNYFSNDDTATRLEAALGPDPDQLPDLGFRPLADALREKATIELTARSYQKRSGVAQPVVFVLPGIMGSHLAQGGDRIWLDPLDLAMGEFANLHIEAAGVEAQAPIASAYGDIVDYLSATHEVMPFPYDWRRSMLDEARRFGETVAATLERTEEPVRILAHSMGGLLARAMLVVTPEVWEALRARDGARLVMLGTPNGGSFVIPRVLLGRERMVRMLALVDFRHDQEELLEIVARFPGLLELLPADTDWDFFSMDAWSRLENAHRDGWNAPHSADLDAARTFRDALERSPIDPERMCYVAGSAPATPVDIEIVPDAKGASRIQFLATDEGDGRVPWRSGPPAGVKIWYMDAKHGDMADHAPAFPAIFELLQTGHTARLPTVAPSVSRAAARYYPLPDDVPEIFPASSDLEAAVLGATPRALIRRLEAAPVKVTVVHGNLSFCESPLAVGHYEGDALFSAEAHLDHHLDNRLSARHALGLYPGPDGTVDVVLNLGGKPGGAIVIGLGKVGELTPKKLSESFTIALLEYAVKYAETQIGEAHAERNEALSVGFSTLLVGTGEGGLSIADSIAAILNSVRQANRALSQTPRGYSVRIDKVQFIELYQDRAVQSARILRELPDDEAFQVDTQIQSLPGGRRRIEYREPEGWWRRLHVKSAADDSLVFTAPTDRARVEVSLLSVQRRNLDRFVAQAVNNPGWDRRLSAAMFELLLPNRLKSFTRDLRDIVLVVDEGSARYPWELLHDRTLGHEEPIVVSVGVIRQFATTAFREQVIEPTELSAFVVGDPPSDFVPLPGARREASLVTQQLKQSDFDVQCEVGTDSASILTALFSDDYQVLHLAGHGVYEHRPDPLTDGAERPVTGMVLGDGTFLTAVEIEQMRQVPPLVFVNCCHLGVIDGDREDAKTPERQGLRDRNVFAASFAAALIKMGVRAVVAAGWAVDDAAALTFADEFYRCMLRGQAFGDAVCAARKETYDLHGDRTNTWGAYQCYGDPAYVLVRTSVTHQAEEQRHFVAPEEVVVELENFAEDAKTASMHGTAALRARLSELLPSIPDAWYGNATLREAMGRAYGEVDQFKEAIAHYAAALGMNKATASIKAAEQLANLRARWAVRLHQGVDDRNDGEKPVALIEESIEELEKLNATFGPTPERCSLLGSAAKRFAQVAKGAERDRRLRAMQEHYEAASDLAEKQSGQADPYPLVNSIVSQVLRYWCGALSRKPHVREAIETALALAQEEEKHCRDVWSGVGKADAMLAKHLFEGDLDDQESSLLEQYEDAWKRGASPREFRSVIEHLDFLGTILLGDPSAKPRARGPQKRIATRRRIAKSIDSLRAELGALIEKTQ